MITVKQAVRICVLAILPFLGGCAAQGNGMGGFGTMLSGTNIVLNGNGGRPGVTAPHQIPGIPHRGTDIRIGGSPRDYGVGSGIQLPTILPPQLYRPRSCGSIQIGGVYSNNC